MAEKLKLAFYWGAGCGGCEVAVLDTNEAILTVGELADIVIWPLAADGKHSDVEALPDGAIDACFFNGGVRNSEIEHVARLLRAKSKTMVAFGACAGLGGVPGLANQYSREETLERVYQTCETVVNGEGTRPEPSAHVPEGIVEIPRLYDRVYPLDEVVDVDYYLPGCPPTPAWIVASIKALASGTLPAKGSVIGVDKILCDECPRKRTDERSVTRFYRPHEIITDSSRCLLEQGVICCGPATRGGCGARCIDANMPCRGCYGPPEGVYDQGAKMLSAASSLVASDDDAEIEQITSRVRDSIGTFCPFSLPKSIVPHARRAS
jgi:F420-non-reducing hydrogenase small subunit